MKSRVVVGLFLLVTLAAGVASAQTPLTGSIKAGLNFATVSGEIGEGASRSARIGGVFGGGVSTMINDKVALDVDFLYSMEGSKAKFSDVFGTVTGTFKNDYIRIPLLFRLGIGSGARPAYLVVGPSIGILVRSKATSEDFTEDTKDDLRKGDLALVVGAGTTLSNNVFVEGRYTLGLTDINAKGTSDEPNRNQVVSVLVGKRF